MIRGSVTQYENIGQQVSQDYQGGRHIKTIITIG